MPAVSKNPSWLNIDLIKTESLKELDKAFLVDLGRKLNKSVSQKPEISVCISAWNEELNIIKCLDSLSKSIASVPFEIIVVNNNSTDKTQEVLDTVGVQNYFQEIQGCGVSRQMAQEKAKGKYILLADADCFYHPEWIQKMYKALQKTNTAVVYSKHSFLGNESTKRFHYFLYELGKDFIIELRNIKRPYLNTYGMSMGYLKEQGLREGFVTKNIRGEDGRMCFDLMKYGKVRLVRDSKARVWTSDRNLEQDGSLIKAIRKRIFRELLRAGKYFRAEKPHDTKNSENTEQSMEEYKDQLKRKIKI